MSLRPKSERFKKFIFVQRLTGTLLENVKFLKTKILQHGIFEQSLEFLKSLNPTLSKRVQMFVQCTNDVCFRKKLLLYWRTIDETFRDIKTIIRILAHST